MIAGDLSPLGLARDLGEVDVEDGPDEWVPWSVREKKENGSLGEADGWVRDVSERGRARAGLGWVAGSRAGKLDGLGPVGLAGSFFFV